MKIKIKELFGNVFHEYNEPHLNDIPKIGDIIVKTHNNKTWRTQVRTVKREYNFDNNNKIDSTIIEVEKLN